MKTRQPSDITYSDYFCGWGGSSQGARKRGLRVVMAANHWDLAVDVHNLNFPESDHDLADISQVDPRRHPRSTVAWFSPECTNHSKAKGKKKHNRSQQLALGEEYEPISDAAADRSRATMWDVVRFAEFHRYRYVIVENVVEVRDWIQYPAWRMAMELLGYGCQEVYLNSMHAASPGTAPAPQSRDRVYFVFSMEGERAPDLRITPAAWCARCDCQVDARQSWKNPLRPFGRYRQQYLYRCPACLSVVEPFTVPAAYAIDWSHPGQRIGDKPVKEFRDRKTKELLGVGPLAPKTMARIEAGIRRYARPVHLEAAGNTYDAADPKHPQHGNPDSYYRVWPADSEPMRTLHTIESKALACPPMLVPAGGTWNDTARSVGDVMRCRTTRESEGVATPPLLVPVEGREGKKAGSACEPLRTQSTRNETAVVVPPFIAELRGGGSKHRPVAEPLATVTASGNHHGLVQPPDVDGVVMRNNNERGGNGHMSTPVATEPLRSLTTTGHQSLVTWHAQYGFDTGLLRSLAVPLPTQTTVVGDALLSGDGLPAAEDCLFRMLEPHEIAAGMAFERDYKVLGNKREQVKGYGNAVTPCASTLLLDRVVDAITGTRVVA